MPRRRAARTARRHAYPSSRRATSSTSAGSCKARRRATIPIRVRLMDKRMQNTAYVEIRPDLFDRYGIVVGKRIPVQSTVPQLIFDDPERGMAKAYIVDVPRLSLTQRLFLVASLAERG